MNIGMFTDCYFPSRNGVVSSMAQLREGLEKRGQNTSVFTVRHPADSGDVAGVHKFASMPFRSDIDLRLGLPAYRRALSLARRERLDLVHSHTEFTMGWLGRQIARKLNIPHVHTCHTLFEEYKHYSILTRWLPGTAIQKALNGFLSGVDAVICPSGKMQQYLTEFVPNLDSLIIENGVDEKRFTPALPEDPDAASLKSQYGIRKSDRVILVIGRLGREKRLVPLLHHLSDLLRQNSHYKFLLVGGGPLKSALRRSARNLGIEQQLILTDFVGWSQVHRFYSMSDVFASISLSEVCPMTLIEAGMCGIPVIARRDAATEAIVRNGFNGFLIDRDEQLGEKVGFLLENTNRRNELSSNCITCSQRFTIGNCSKHVHNLYQRLIQDDPE
jgi:1,2-diacylglycerol 3-alpha-glucosyltransferase